MKVSVSTDAATDRRKRIRRLFVLIILASIIVHVLVGIGAGIWVITRYFVQPKAQFAVQKQVKMVPEDREHVLQMEKAVSLRPKPVYNNRIQSLRPSRLALPELPAVPLDTVIPIDTKALISDQVDGMGRYGEGGGRGVGFFGGEGAVGSGLLTGYLYDLKQGATGRPIEMTWEKYNQIMARLSRAPAEGILSKYFRAPDPLYASHLAIPGMSADVAPKEFQVEDKVKPMYWVAVYSGRMVAPETGRFRFLGYGDNILFVKVNGRLVLDASYPRISQTVDDSGLSFGVEKGEAYDIEVIVGESAGGLFAAWLQIQEEAPDSRPYWFRMTSSEVRFQPNHLNPAHRMPEQMINGPVWLPASKKTTPMSGL